MAKNQKLPKALHISGPVPSGVVSGQPVKVGQICGVSILDRDSNGESTIWLDGSWEVQVTGAAAFGDPIYITSAGALNRTATGNFIWGVALGSKAAAAGPLEVAPVGYTTQTAAGA